MRKLAILGLLLACHLVQACSENAFARPGAGARSRRLPPLGSGLSGEALNVLDQGFGGDWEFWYSGEDFDGTSWTEGSGLSETLTNLDGAATADSNTTGLSASDALGAGRINQAVYFDGADRVGNFFAGFGAIADGEGLHIRALVNLTAISNGDSLFFWQPTATSRVYLQMSTVDRITLAYQASSATLYQASSPSNFFSNTGQWALVDFVMIDENDATPYGEMYNNGTKATLPNGTVDYGEFESDGSASFRIGDQTGFDGSILWIGVRGNTPPLTEAQHDADCAALGLSCS